MDRTDLEIDKPLANACSLDVRAHVDALGALREKNGRAHRVGRLCSNLIPMLRNLPDYVRQDWASHESQTLQAKIAWQLIQLEAALKEARQ